MKGKLIKVDNIYRLLKEDDFHEFKLIIGTTDEEYQKAFSDHCYPLSLKNCQAIENGYDLDELADKETEKYVTLTPKSFKRGFLYGFQKALEILGDKKFSEEDMLQAFLKGVSLQIDAPTFQQSLQQTEWDVEIVEQCLDPTCDGVNRKGECITTGKPKLDADGCLILKRIV